MKPTRDEIKTEAFNELFDAAQAMLNWLRELCPRDRPIAKFNRLQDAIDRVREAHQMDQP